VEEARQYREQSFDEGGFLIDSSLPFIVNSSGNRFTQFLYRLALLSLTLAAVSWNACLSEICVCTDVIFIVPATRSFSDSWLAYIRKASRCLFRMSTDPGRSMSDGGLVAAVTLVGFTKRVS
jgi:hypothetical protein